MEWGWGVALAGGEAASMPYLCCKSPGSPRSVF